MNFKKYFARKPVDELIEEAESSQELTRAFGAWQLIMLGIGAIIGAGIFVLIGSAAGAHAGPAVTLSFILSALACACAGLCYAELASSIPIAGSSYTYAYASLGEIVAWIIAGMIVLTYIVGGASVASGWSGYMVSFLADYGINIPPQFTVTTGTVITLADGTQTVGVCNLAAILIALAITYVVYLGTEASAWINTIIVTAKMLVLCGFILIGAAHIDPSNWTPFIPENTGNFGAFGWSGVIGGASIVFLAFSGFDAVSTAAQEAKNPQKDLPIGILGSLIVAAITYIAVAAVLTGVAHYSELNVAQPIAVAVDKMGMPWFSTVIKLGAIIGITSVLLAMIYSTVRVLYTVAKDGLLPSLFRTIHPKHKTPHILTITIGSLIAILSTTLPISELAGLANFGILVTFSIVCFGTLFLRYRFPDLPRPFKCPLVPWIPLAGIIMFVTIIAGLSSETYKYAAVWTSFLILVYIVYGSKNSKLLQSKTF
jgi:APA family basic amino acid/polyamine antiporter